MGTKAKILVVDDEKDIRFLLSDILTDEGYSVAQAAHSEAAFAEIAKDVPDLVILDIWLENSDRDGMEILAEIKKLPRPIPVLMISGHGNIEMAVKAVKIGAYDFIEKPFNTARLLTLVTRAIETGRLKRGGSVNAITLVAGTPDMLAVQRAAQKAASGDARILITGAWGSGRGHLARWIHQESGRANNPFIAVPSKNMNASALTDVLLQVSNGTLVLRDVEEMPADGQSTLLARVNGKCDARVIATSVSDLKTRDFLPDLYERLSVTNIAMPPLDERKSDITDLVLSLMGEGFTASDEVLAQLKHRAWPGQITELKAVISTALVRMKLAGAHELTQGYVNGGDAPVQSESDTQKAWLECDLRTAREAFERWYFDHLMERYDGNVSQVAAFAGMDRTALHRKLKSLKDEAEKLAS